VYLRVLTFTYVYLRLLTFTYMYMYIHVLACTDTISMRMINSRGQAQQVTAGGVPFWHPTSFSKATLHGRHLSVVVNYIDQVECPPGSWCADGVKQPCPLGTYVMSCTCWWYSVTSSIPTTYRPHYEPSFSVMVFFCENSIMIFFWYG
jgi:hypothetical protein